MLYQNRSFDDLTGLQPWFIAEMLHTKVSTPKKINEKCWHTASSHRAIEEFSSHIHEDQSLPGKTPIPFCEMQIFPNQTFFLFFKSWWEVVLPKWEPEAKTCRDVEDINNKYGFKVRLVEGNSVTELHFAESLLSFPSIILFHFSHASGLNNIHNIAWARKRQMSSNSCPSPDHFDSCSVPVRLHLLK